MTPHAALERGLGELALELPEGAVDRLLRYAGLLEKWNRTYNLTAIRNPLDIVTHHLLDSLAVVAPLGPLVRDRLVDVGSGGGLPGVPIAVARPAWRVTVNDASQKKAAFLRQVAIELRLDNLDVHAGRVEGWRPQAKFDAVISRAFADLGRFVALCRHLARAGGILAAMKGGLEQAELAGVPKDCDCSTVIRLHVPLLEEERHLVVCRVPD